MLDPSSSAPGADSDKEITSCCYDILAADAHGHLHHIPFPCSASHGSSKSQDALPILPSLLPFKSTTAYGSSRAVHKVACGILQDGTRIAALARRDASIDLLAISSAPTSTSSRPNRLSAQLLLTIHEPRMRLGMERWVGLAVGKSWVYTPSCLHFWNLWLNALSPLLQTNLFVHISRRFPPNNPRHLHTHNQHNLYHRTHLTIPITRLHLPLPASFFFIVVVQRKPRPDAFRLWR